MMRMWITGALVVAFLAGCQSTGTQNAAPIEERPLGGTAAGGATGGTTTSGVTTAPVGGAATGGAGAAALRDPNNILSKRVIYFDYDSYVVKDEYRAIIDAHAKYLAANKAARVTLQGHTDERGTREYNIALGQKRADAVKKLMLLLGATEMQVETVSFGKEKPKTDGHDESAWSQNRRVEIVHAGE
jgi:peptidoglycan-associated lipoprotein